MTISNTPVGNVAWAKILSLSLPCHPSHTDRAVEAFLGPLPMFVQTEDEIIKWIDENKALWVENLTPPSDLKAAIESFIEAGAPSHRSDIAKKYVEAHIYLCKKNSLEHSEATALLRHLYLIADLRENGNYSAVRTYHAIEAVDPHIDLNWRFVMNLCEKLKIGTDLSATKMQSLFDSEKKIVDSEYFESSIEEMLGELKQIVDSMDCRSRIIENITELVSGGSTHAPYLQVLHFLSTITEFYDHPIRYSYEFKPRGEVGKWLFAQYPKAFAAGGSPFLNNVKSVEQLDASWANSKKPAQRKSALALVRILEVLDNYPYIFKKEACKLIRKLIIKRVWSEAPETEVYPAEKLEQAKEKLTSIAARETNTLGIVEQGFVEMLAVTKCIDARETRGIGDPVNASNAAKKKLGDCDLIDMEKRELSAFEAHAGTLNQNYLDEHLSTIHGLIETQAKKLEPFGGIRNWAVKVIFYAHQIKLDAPPSHITIDGVTVKLEFKTFNEAMYELPDKKGLVDLYNSILVSRLNSKWTPDHVRKTFINLQAHSDNQLELSA